jgi:cell division initiation protein
MKITPLEIRQKTFEKTLRGYDKDEVNGFLLTLSQEWERNQDEIKELRMKIDASGREVDKLREVETSLFRTLKTAETTGANVIDQANKSAELILRESQIKAEAMINEAKMKAKNTIDEADQNTRQLLSEMEDQLKSLAEQYKTLQSQRDNLLSDMKRMASETLDRMERIEASGRGFDPDKHLAGAKRQVRKNLFPNEMEKKPAPAPSPSPELSETKVSNGEGLPKSFFDDIQ